ncbi:hypothetical protein [Methylocystis parvus]|uniref:Uncharacterized protein n=1 Tax=Methylocystis parvus TaxID=134 RepID=A0A6B8M1M4_9HYPH|nr:hypothetical protein [Methylocystis parvus]QGM97704.1 hypothetical protein F7D14_09645 [Methylocystis parvus]WBJ98361.1 hypothetical protein MMG94_09945 [Methylocystis parvus OBBP]
MTERWDAECSLLAHLVAAENGEPLNISEADLVARFCRIIREARVTKKWKEKHRLEVVKIEAALDGRGRWPTALLEGR